MCVKKIDIYWWVRGQFKRVKLGFSYASRSDFTNPKVCVYKQRIISLEDLSQAAAELYSIFKPHLICYVMFNLFHFTDVHIVRLFIGVYQLKFICWDFIC